MSMMNLKSSLVNRIVVTLITLIWLLSEALPQSTEKSACITADTARESLLWFISLFVGTLSLDEFVKKCDSSSFLQKCIHSYIGCICKKNVFVSPQVFCKRVFVVTLVAFEKKNSQSQLCLASQENRIGFISLVICFDLLGPKFLMRTRQLKKGGQNAIPMVVTCMPEKVKIKSSFPQISLTQRLQWPIFSAEFLPKFYVFLRISSKNSA